MDSGRQGPAVVVQRLLAAINAHDLEAMVSCFADDYVNEWPAHPQRGFQGRAQVRQNWSQIFAGVPNLQARLPRMAVDGDTAVVGAPGVSIFGVADGRLAWVRFYLEPVEETSGDVSAHTSRVVGTTATTPVEEARS